MTLLRNPTLFLLLVAVCAGARAQSPSPSLPSALADHTLRDTGLRKKIILTAPDGRQIVVEFPLLAYIPNFQGVDFMALVKSGAAEPPAAVEPPVPTEGAAHAPAEKPAPREPHGATRGACLQEIQEIVKALGKLERSVNSEDAGGEVRALVFRLNAVLKQLEATP